MIEQDKENLETQDTIRGQVQVLEYSGSAQVQGTGAVYTCTCSEFEPSLQATADRFPNTINCISNLILKSFI